MGLSGQVLLTPGAGVRMVLLEATLHLAPVMSPYGNGHLPCYCSKKNKDKQEEYTD